MNAYELADELDSMLKGAGLNNNRVPTMLRQQADRIKDLTMKLNVKAIKVAELEKENGKLEFMVGYLEEEVSQLKE